MTIHFMKGGTQPLCPISLHLMRGIVSILKATHPALFTEDVMRFWKVAAILALASIPIILLNRKKGVRPVVGDSDNIFESELSQD